MIALVSYMTQILIALVALANLIVSFHKGACICGKNQRGVCYLYNDGISEKQNGKSI